MAVKINPSSVKVSVKVLVISVNAFLSDLHDRISGARIFNHRPLEQVTMQQSRMGTVSE